MGGADARRVLIEYLRMEKADHLGSAIRALAKVDPGVAKVEARRLLRRDGAEFMDYLDRKALERTVEEE
jgi:hypothetical protein